MDGPVRKLLIVGLALLVLGSPGGLLAQARRGADIIVSRRSGGLIEGELIAVKPGSIVVLDLEGKDESIDVSDIGTIRILRRSKAWSGALIGFLPGAIGGAVWGHYASDGDMEELGAFIGGLVFGTAGGLLGLVAGAGAGLDAEISLSGMPGPAVNAALARLNRQAREPGVYGPSQMIAPSGATGPGALSGGQRRPRFKLTWSPGILAAGTEHWQMEEAVPFRFTEELPPGEAGPYASQGFSSGDYRSAFQFARVDLAYEWSRHLSAVIELHAMRQTTDRYGELVFTSTLDGFEYWSSIWNHEAVNATSLLVGLSFRPFPPAFLQPHVFEIGAAAGPSWIGTWISAMYYDTERTKVPGGTTWSARLRASYDYYFNPAFSMGVFAEYQWLRPVIPSYTATETLPFYHGSDYANTLTRVTEVTYPERRLDLSGFVCGLRFGFRF
jgi:hypothetical protein